MKEFKFKRYDSGFVRAYFTSDKKLYCIQPNYTIELLVCSSDGEPSHPVDASVNDTFINMPPDGDTWSWIELLEYFSQCESGGDYIRRMNKLFEVE